MSSTLLMHVDSNRKTGLTIGDLRGLASRPATDTHIPIGHSVVRDMVAEHLEPLGLEIVNEQIGVSTLTEEEIDGKAVSVYNKAFGVFDVRGADYAIDSTASTGLSVGWRNSMNKVLPASICVGSRVFVCDNLCLSGEMIIKRRHTKNIMSDLPDLIVDILGKIESYAKHQFSLYNRLREINITQDEAVAVIAEACAASGKAFLARKNVLPILDFYNHDHANDDESKAGIVYNRDQHGHGTAWALLNAGTAFAKQYLNRNIVDSSSPLVDWHKTFSNRFGRDLIRSESTSVAMPETIDSEPDTFPEVSDEEDNTVAATNTADGGDWEAVEE